METAEKLTSGAFFTANGWSLGAKKVDDGLKIAHSQAAYYRQKPGNTLYSFDVAINNPNTWPSFALRASNISGDYTNSKTYLLGIKTDQFELQRFDSGKRTMIFGDASFNPLGGPGAPNSLNGKTMFEYGKRYSVTLGTIREEEGVRILFFVNGEPVFDYVDKAEGYIAEDGYLGIYAFQGDFTLYPFSDLSYEE